eukprot:779453-Amphidinium_carterae.1
MSSDERVSNRAVKAICFAQQPDPLMLKCRVNSAAAFSLVLSGVARKPLTAGLPAFTRTMERRCRPLRAQWRPSDCAL